MRCSQGDRSEPVATGSTRRRSPRWRCRRRGGLGYGDCLDLMHGLAERGTLAGLVLAEYVPERDDARRACALMAARLVAVGIGLIFKEHHASMSG